MSTVPNIIERVSITNLASQPPHLVGKSPADGGDYTTAKTPDVIEGGAIRAGGAPDLYSRANIGVLGQYAATGIVYGSILNIGYPLLNNYLHMTGVETASANALLAIPLTFKFVVGGISDCNPIRGYRRRPYMIFGWLLTFIACLTMAVIPLGDPYFPDVTLSRMAEADLTPEQFNALNRDAPKSGVKYIALLVVAVLGLVFSGAAADGMLAELAMREPEKTRGRIQTMSYAVQQLFSCVSVAMIGFGLNSTEYGGTFSHSMGFNALMGVCAFVSMAIIPITWFCITEEVHTVGRSGKVYVKELYDLLTHRVLYQLIAFRFFRMMFQWVQSTASYPVQYNWAKVTPISSSTGSIIGYLCSAIALFLAQKYCLLWPWRKMIAVCQITVIVIDCFPTFFTIWDVYRSQWFWLGGPIVENFPYFMGWTISTLAVVEILDIGMEGGVYGLLSTVESIAYPFSLVVSKNVCANFDIGYEFLAMDDSHVRTEVTYTYLFSYGSKLFSLLFLFLLPRQKAETQELKRSGGKSKLFGNITIAYIAFAFAWSLMTNMMSFSSKTKCLKIAGGDGC